MGKYYKSHFSKLVKISVKMSQILTVFLFINIWHQNCRHS